MKAVLALTSRWKVLGTHQVTSRFQQSFVEVAYVLALNQSLTLFPLVLDYRLYLLEARCKGYIPIEDWVLKSWTKIHFLICLLHCWNVGLFQLVYQVIVLRFFVEVEQEYVFEALFQLLRYHLEQLLSHFELQALNHHLLECALEISPWEVIIVVEVDHKVEDGFDVISPRFVVTAAWIERGEHEVAREVCQINFLDMLLDR